MDAPQPNPARQPDEPDRTGQSTEQPIPTSTIESMLPAADANQLLELIKQGHNPNDLQQLIHNSKTAA